MSYKIQTRRQAHEASATNYHQLTTQAVSYIQASCQTDIIVTLKQITLLVGKKDGSTAL